ncbi:MAG: thioredoxin [Bacillota bacterium]|nr:thioredoxin [Bacillota bacterium]
MDKLQSKMSSEETFVLVVTRDNCRYCDEFYDLMETYLLNHPVEIWDLSIDGETEEEKEEVETEIRELFPSFAGTPNIFYIKEGKLKSQLNNMDYDLTEELFDKWVNKYELDKKGKL